MMSGVSAGTGLPGAGPHAGRAFRGVGLPLGRSFRGGRSFPRGRCFPQRGEGGHLDQPFRSQPLGWLPGIRE